MILFYIIASLLLYLEPVEIVAGFTFGIIWKLILMFFLFFPVFFQILKEKQIEMFVFFSILLSFKILMSYTSLDYFSHTITLFTKEMMFPLLYLFFIQKIEKKENLIFLVEHFSIVIILSFLPYMIGILEPFALGYDLAEFGHTGEYGLIGVFIKPHSAAITLAFAMTVITTHIKKENSNIKNLFYVGLLLFGFYASILTYVRTGLTMYVIVLLYLYLRSVNLKKIIFMILTSIVIFGAGVYLYQTNEIIQMRLNDKNKYNSSGGNGSGRLIFWENAIENWLDDEPIVIYIGLGYDYALEKMNEDVGQFIFAHNQYIQVLQQEGLIGFSFFLLTLFFIYQYILKYKSSQYYITMNAIFMALLIEYMFQGGFFFPMVLFLSAYLVIIKKDVEETLNKENNE
jgi:O-antigen ligase